MEDRRIRYRRIWSTLFVSLSVNRARDSILYFQSNKQEYQIEIKKEGYSPKLFTISASLDGWYIGNILLGGLIGMLIVDPASGAMFKISEKQVNETLSPLSTSELQVYDINHLPEGVDKSNLVAIQ